MDNKRPIDLLVRGDVVYPMAPGGEIFLDGEVAVRGGEIVYAGPRKDDDAWLPAQTLEGGGKAVLPGFVNCHSHTGSIIFRSQSDDGAGGAALYTVAFRAEKDVTPEDWHDLAILGVIDMIKAGFTTINDIWYEPEALAETCLKAGLRAQIAYKVFDVKLEDLHSGDYTRYTAVGDERLKRGVELVEAWHGAGDGLISGRLGPHATDTCSPELHQLIGAEARRLGVGCHSHVAQSPGEVEYIRSAFGKCPAEHLRDLGVLGPGSVLAHLTFASEADLDAVAQSGARYAHCSTIYPRRGVYPDMAAIRGRGIPWGLATDWLMNDPFEAMRNAMNAMRMRQSDYKALSSQEALSRATTGSADVLGLGTQVGQLVSGYRADLIQINIDQPHLSPFYADYSSIAYYARAADVVTSVINGRTVMQDRVVLGLDEADSLAAVEAKRPRWAALMQKLGGAGHPGLCGCGHG